MDALITERIILLLQKQTDEWLKNFRPGVTSETNNILTLIYPYLFTYKRRKRFIYFSGIST